MGKKHKDKDEVPNPNSVSNRDIIQRLNFLYQASVYLNSVGRSGSSTSVEPLVAPNDVVTPKGVKEETRKRKRRRRNVVSTSDLSRSYIKSMKAVGLKTTVKIDPSVKRTLCKGCNVVLIPGSTATIRVKPLPSHGHAVTYTCTSCNTSRRIPAPPTLLPQPEVPIPEPSTSQSFQPHLTANLPSQSQPPAPQLTEAMDTDMHPPAETLDSRQANQRNRKKRKKPPVPRLPPLFARDVGHIVFRGNDRLET